MNVTEVRVFLRNGPAKLKAFANLTLDGCFAVRDLKVVEGEKGLFVAMPSKKLPGGEFMDVAHPVTRELREVIREEVMRAYEKAVAEKGG